MSQNVVAFHAFFKECFKTDPKRDFKTHRENWKTHDFQNATETHPKRNIRKNGAPLNFQNAAETHHKTHLQNANQNMSAKGFGCNHLTARKNQNE